MSLSGSGNGGVPKRPGAGKPSKGYPKVSGADDATIDVRKIQKPPAELPPIQEPANEPPAESVAPSEPAEPVEPAEAVTPLPEPPLPPQDKAELDGQPSPLPPSPEVPNSVEGHPGNPSPQASEDHRPSAPTRPDRPGWIEIPEVNVAVLGAEKAPLPADKVPAQTQPHAEDRTGGNNGAAMDKAGSGNVQSNESQGPFLSLGEGREEFTVPSRKNRGQASGEAINSIADSPPTESENVRRVENQDSVPQVVPRSALRSGALDGVAPAVEVRSIPSPPGKADGGSADLIRRNAAENGNTDRLPAERIGWGEFGRAHIGKQIKNRAGEIATILEVKNGMVTARSETGQTSPLRQGDAVLVDANGAPLPASNKTAKRNPTEAGASDAESTNGPVANLVPKDGDDPSTIVVLEGFKITKEFYDYLRLIEQVTGNAFHPTQLRELLKEVTERSFSPLDKAALSAHTKKFTQKVKDMQISEWEDQVSRSWSKYSEQVCGRGERVNRDVGELYDAHHVIPQKYGGPHVWWNLIPAAFPEEHQRRIHQDIIFKTLFA